jgi:hypothetical protein
LIIQSIMFAVKAFLNKCISFQLFFSIMQCFRKLFWQHNIKSKSQNIWQQIILFSSTVMQMICAWHNIWTLSGRLSLIRNVQLMNDRGLSYFINKIYSVFLVGVKRDTLCCKVIMQLIKTKVPLHETYVGNLNLWFTSSPLTLSDI